MMINHPDNNMSANNISSITWRCHKRQSIWGISPRNANTHKHSSHGQQNDSNLNSAN